VLAAGTEDGSVGLVFGRSHFDARNEDAAGLGRLRVQEAGAIRECEEHGCMQARADPHAQERALVIARQDPTSGVSPEEAVSEVQDVLDSLGDTCPECLAA
jgi:hypothetical protein